MEGSNFIVQSSYAALKRLLPFFQKNSKASCITAALALLALQQLYSIIKIPKHLESFPRTPSLALAKSYYNLQSPPVQFKRFSLPAMEKGDGNFVSRLPFGWMVVITNPAVAKHVLMKSQSNPKHVALIKDIGPLSPIGLFLGEDSVVIANGKTWKDQRKILNPVFHRSMPIKTMINVLSTLTSVIDQKNGRVSIHDSMKDFTLDVLGLTILGIDFKALKGDPDNWKSVYEPGMSMMSDPLFNMFGKMNFLLPMFSAKRKHNLNCLYALQDRLKEASDQKRVDLKNGTYKNTPENEKDLVTLMLEADMKGEGIISDESIQHNIAAFFLAGHETTTQALSFCFYNLAKNKRVQDKLRKEVIEKFGDGPMNIKPTVEELKSLEYMDLIIKENLRLFGPAITVLPRIAEEDIVVQNTFIPKKTKFYVDIFAIQHDPRNWANPDEFIPERFEKGGEYESNEGLTWLPFGSGARQCIGMNFSLLEQRLVLATLVRKYNITIPRDSKHYRHVVMDGSSLKAPSSVELVFTKRH
ncbi:cytochrome P450 [Sporodiniella umbellata]|nr:cytochrome P450 [Sporodiniella umbellata]